MNRHWHNIEWSRVLWRGLLSVLCLLSFGARVGALGLQDYFASRETIFTANGTLTGNNTGASVEVGEPKHGGKSGGHSLWVTWVAPANGVATFDTHGSGFDTLMSAYTLSPTNATTVDRLREEARNDDDPGAEPTSLIQFGAIAGQSYQIAVDGFAGATGSVVLNWSFIPTATPPPVIVGTPNDQAARQGDTVTLNVNMIASGDLNLAWFFNGVEDPNQKSTNYVISSLQSTNVGRYQLRVTVGSGGNRVRFFTTPVEVQINSDGSTNTLAADKLLDSSTTPLVGESGGGSGGGRLAAKLDAFNIRPSATTVGVVRGYNGSQVFNTTYATTDPAEPVHCGVAGGASYWLMYQPPTNGTVSFDTAGSTYDTVMEVYTFNGALTGYSDLISIACDNDSLGAQGASRVTFQAVNTRSYVVVVAGVNGARGTAWLNYLLDTNQPALPPTLKDPVMTQTVVAGSRVTLFPNIEGALPLQFAWQKNAVPIPGIAIPFIQFTNAAPAQSGDYSLTVTNDLGALVVTIPVHVVDPPQCSASWDAGILSLNFATVGTFRYTIQQATNIAGPWAPCGEPFIGNGAIFTTNLPGAGVGFYRVRIE